MEKEKRERRHHHRDRDKERDRIVEDDRWHHDEKRERRHHHRDADRDEDDRRRHKSSRYEKQDRDDNDRQHHKSSTDERHDRDHKMSKDGRHDKHESKEKARSEKRSKDDSKKDVKRKRESEREVQANADDKSGSKRSRSETAGEERALKVDVNGASSPAPAPISVPALAAGPTLIPVPARAPVATVAVPTPVAAEPALDPALSPSPAPTQVPPAQATTAQATPAQAPPSQASPVNAVSPTDNGDPLAKVARMRLLRKELAEKLKKLPALATENSSPATPPAPLASTGTVDVVANAANLASYKRAQECVARLGFQQPPGSLALTVPGAPSTGPKVVKAPVLRLDKQGREIDEHGVVVDNRKSNISTLKVNINKQKKDAFQILHPELEEDPVNNPHFDTELGIDRTKLVRSKRATFQFVDEGKWTKRAEIFRLNNRYGAVKAREIRSKQAALAKAKAEGDINPNLIEVAERIFKDDKQVQEPIPNVEWWDLTVLPPQAQSYDDVIDGAEVKYKKEKINIYVEHPVPIEPPAEAAPPPPQPLKLTKKEQKKMRTQRRLAREKERQELIRQGKIEPPKAKVKMSNLMSVLGAEATQDPTRLEMEIRSAAAERERAHTDRNLARKLTPAERREKKEKRLFDDPGSLETIVAVFRVKEISHPQTRFKVDINAQENRLTGCAIITDGMTVVIVEGGAKSIKRYTKLMVRRINWSAKEEGDEQEQQGEEERENKCVQVWQGSVARPAFDRFFFQKFHTQGAARKYLADAGVGHYWDSALHYKEE